MSLRDESPTITERWVCFPGYGKIEVSEPFAGGVSNLDIWRPESAKLLPKNDSVVFSIREKKRNSWSTSVWQLWSPELRVLQPPCPFVPGIFCLCPAAARHCLCCKEPGGQRGAHKATFVPWHSLHQWAIEKDKSRRMYLLSNEVQTHNSWDLGV